MRYLKSIIIQQYALLRYIFKLIFILNEFMVATNQNKMAHLFEEFFRGYSPSRYMVIGDVGFRSLYSNHEAFVAPLEDYIATYFPDTQFRLVGFELPDTKEAREDIRTARIMIKDNKLTNVEVIPSNVATDQFSYIEEFDLIFLIRPNLTRKVIMSNVLTDPTDKPGLSSQLMYNLARALKKQGRLCMAIDNLVAASDDDLVYLLNRANLRYEQPFRRINYHDTELKIVNAEPGNVKMFGYVPTFDEIMEVNFWHSLSRNVALRVEQEEREKEAIQETFIDVCFDPSISERAKRITERSVSNRYGLANSPLSRLLINFSIEVPNESVPLSFYQKVTRFHDRLEAVTGRLRHHANKRLDGIDQCTSSVEGLLGELSSAEADNKLRETISHLKNVESDVRQISASTPNPLGNLREEDIPTLCTEATGVFQDVYGGLKAKEMRKRLQELGITI